jgi:hypothetical protein
MQGMLYEFVLDYIENVMHSDVYTRLCLMGEKDIKITVDKSDPAYTRGLVGLHFEDCVSDGWGALNIYLNKDYYSGINKGSLLYYLDNVYVVCGFNGSTQQTSVYYLDSGSLPDYFKGIFRNCTLYSDVYSPYYFPEHRHCNVYFDSVSILDISDLLKHRSNTYFYNSLSIHTYPETFDDYLEKCYEICVSNDIKDTSLYVSFLDESCLCQVLKRNLAIHDSDSEMFKFFNNSNIKLILKCKTKFSLGEIKDCSFGLFSDILIINS